MFRKNPTREQNQSIFVGSAYWLANVLALIATVLMVPGLWKFIDPHVKELLLSLYEPESAVWAYWLIWLASWAAIFFTLRMTFVTAFMAAAIAAAVRFV